ncbi:MAG: metalloregulator ArsR/SmtB family transcription factor [Gemmatimonadaceae bacterium]|jgi:ArsR family transcriptional regulator, lead/cadmium/zinc/bismuth-responsive transcriptional repressor|nr:metalloregulator ArsR/SmtB family transcription factor [Gemmatimonadaceae bacterium]
MTPRLGRSATRPTRDPRSASSEKAAPRSKARKTATPPAASTSGVQPYAEDDRCDIRCVDHAKVARVRALAEPAAALATLAETFKALGDPTRLRILTALALEELCVCDLATLVDVSESAVSHSLRTLRQLRLVRYRKRGKIAYYALDDGQVGQMVAQGLEHLQETAR